MNRREIFLKGTIDYKLIGYRVEYYKANKYISLDGIYHFKDVEMKKYIISVKRIDNDEKHEIELKTIYNKSFDMSRKEEIKCYIVDTFNKIEYYPKPIIEYYDLMNYSDDESDDELIYVKKEKPLISINYELIKYQNKYFAWNKENCIGCDFKRTNTIVGEWNFIHHSKYLEFDDPKRIEYNKTKKYPILSNINISSKDYLYNVIGYRIMRHKFSDIEYDINDEKFKIKKNWRKVIIVSLNEIISGKKHELYLFKRISGSLLNMSIIQYHGDHLCFEVEEFGKIEYYTKSDYKILLINHANKNFKSRFIEWSETDNDDYKADGYVVIKKEAFIDK